MANKPNYLIYDDMQRENMCDDEHQGIHGKFVLAYIEKYGFTEKGVELYDLCEEKIQHLPKKLIALRTKRKTKI